MMLVSRLPDNPKAVSRGIASHTSDQEVDHDHVEDGDCIAKL